MQTACFDKAQKFTEKALLNLQRLKLKEQTLGQSSRSLGVFSGSVFISNKLHLMFLENQIRCSIAMGNRCQALTHLGEAFQLCDQDSKLMGSHAPQLHCLLGIYSFSVNCKDLAISQFNQSLQSTNDTDLWLYNAMNLALCYLSSLTSNPNIKSQLLSILDNITPEKIQTQNTSLTALAHLFRALKLFLNSNYQQAQ